MGFIKTVRHLFDFAPVYHVEHGRSNDKDVSLATDELSVRHMSHTV